MQPHGACLMLESQACATRNQPVGQSVRRRLQLRAPAIPRKGFLRLVQGPLASQTGACAEGTLFRSALNSTDTV